MVDVALGTRSGVDDGGQTKSRDALPVAVFDGDDTLWITEPLYDRAREAAAAVVLRAGLDAASWDELQRRIDVANVAHFGLSAKRFPTSCREAYEALCVSLSLPPDPDIASEVYDAAAGVFSLKAPLVPDAYRVLSMAREKYRVVLLTQGDEAVQLRRLSDSGLGPLFDAIFIVPRKDTDVLRTVLTTVGAHPADSWMVGNSLPSDINPALKVGMRAIWVDSHVWEHERREAVLEAGQVEAAASLSEALTLLTA